MPHLNGLGYHSCDYSTVTFNSIAFMGKEIQLKSFSKEIVNLKRMITKRNKENQTDRKISGLVELYD